MVVDYDLVIHLAAYANIRESLEDPEKFYVNNVLMAKPLFDWCRDTNTRLLYASSSAVEEEYWENPYAMTKWVNEMIIPSNFGLRFTTVYGPDSREDMMYRMLEDKTAKYVTNHRRDWIHKRCLSRTIPLTQMLMVPVSVGIKFCLRKRTCRKDGYGNLPLKEDTPGERLDNAADTTVLTSIGWFPTVNVMDTVKKNLVS